MSSTATYEIERVTIAGEERIFFKCPVGGFASLRPGICPKCGEFLMSVSASPAASTDNYSEGRVPDIAPASVNDHEAGVAE